MPRSRGSTCTSSGRTARKTPSPAFSVCPSPRPASRWVRSRSASQSIHATTSAPSETRVSTVAAPSVLGSLCSASILTCSGRIPTHTSVPGGAGAGARAASQRRRELDLREARGVARPHPPGQPVRHAHQRARPPRSRAAAARRRACRHCASAPSQSTAMRSASSSAWRRSWVTSATAMSGSRDRARRDPATSASRPAASRSSKGSSSSSTSGAATKARASARRRASPPESVVASRAGEASRCRSARAPRRRALAPLAPRDAASPERHFRVPGDVAREQQRVLEHQRRRRAARAPRSRPRSAPTSPASARSSVVLPAPFGPRIASTSPRRSASDRTRSVKPPARAAAPARSRAASTASPLIAGSPAAPPSARRRARR